MQYRNPRGETPDPYTSYTGRDRAPTVRFSLPGHNKHRVAPPTMQVPPPPQPKSSSPFIYHARVRPAHRRSPLPLRLFLLGLAATFFFLFARELFSYRKTRTQYANLSAQITGGAPADATVDALHPDFAALTAQNPDVAAWLDLPGLSQSLPVVQCQDNSTYLHRRFDGSDGNGGCLFLDARNTSGSDALYQVIYGHNQHDGSMFGRLPEYLDADFCSQWPEFGWYTPSGSYRARIFSVHTITTDDAAFKADWTEGDAYNEFLLNLKSASEVALDVTPEPGSRVLTLSTCTSSYANNSRRVVVHAILEAIEG